MIHLIADPRAAYFYCAFPFLGILCNTLSIISQLAREQIQLQAPLKSCHVRLQGEFETGFERGGQTREHAQLAKTLGVAKLVIAINKMDDPSIAGPSGEWSKERYDEIIARITPFLRNNCGYHPKKDIIFLPMSGLMGTNIKDPPPKHICSW